MPSHPVEDYKIIKELRAEKFGLAGTPKASTVTYTQNFTTADRTVNTATATVVGDLVATQNTGWGASTEANFDKIATAIDALITDVADIRQTITAIIDDLQAYGLVG